MKEYLVWIIILVCGSCNVEKFCIVETGTIYSYSMVDSVIVDTLKDSTILKVYPIGKKGKYSYTHVNNKDSILSQGIYLKTRIVRTWGQQQEIDGTVKKVRFVYYKPK